MKKEIKIILEINKNKRNAPYAGVVIKKINYNNLYNEYEKHFIKKTKEELARVLTREEKEEISLNLKKINIGVDEIMELSKSIYEEEIKKFLKSPKKYFFHLFENMVENKQDEYLLEKNYYEDLHGIHTNELVIDKNLKYHNFKIEIVEVYHNQ